MARKNYVDPNSGGKVNLEDLNIAVDLYVFDRKRTLISIDESQKFKRIAEIKGKKTPFLRGRDNKDGTSSLTTDYTKVGDSSYDGTETLGIESVDIDFNSAYMPLITIELTDVRGKMFELGKDSPYSSFFNFPYPLFKLKVKGYYGKPVTYLLHLTNFKSKLNSENGNFNITCTFNGYTYAYLSDMLLGYLKAIPYTTVGAQVVEEMRGKDEKFVTFDELYEYAKILNKEIGGLKSDNPELQAVALGYDILNKFREIKQNLKTQLTIYNDISSNDQSNFGRNSPHLKAHTDKFLFLKPENTGHISKIKEVLSEISLNVTELNKKITKDEYDLDISLFQLKSGENFFENINKSDFIDTETDVVLDKFGGTSGPKFFDDENNFKYISKRFNELGKGVGNKVTIIYIKNIIDNIDEQSAGIDAIIKDKLVEISGNFFEDIENMSLKDIDGSIKTFDFNIYNYTKVLCDHVDVLMKSIERVSSEAETNDDRDTSLRNISDNLTDISEGVVGRIYAFPEYTVKSAGSNIRTDAWIGKDHPEISEVLFIKELYQGLVESKTREDNFLNELTDSQKQWYSVNPFDTYNYTGGQNIWETVGNSDGSNGDLIRLMALRATTFLGLTVRNPTQDEIIAMSKIEANNMYRALKNQQTKSVIANIGQDSTSDDAIQTAIRESISTDGNEKNRNNLYHLNHGRILEKDSRVTSGWSTLFSGTKTSYENYIYIMGLNDSTTLSDLVNQNNNIADDVRFFLPLYLKESDGNSSYLGNKLISNAGDRFKLLDNKGRIKLREAGNIFFSDYMGNHVTDNDKPDDGSTYLDIISYEVYNSVRHGNDSYGIKHIKNNNIKRGLTFSESELSSNTFKDVYKNVLFNGRLNNNEFMSYSTDNGSYEFFNYFYSGEQNSNKGPLPTLARKRTKKQTGADIMKNGVVNPKPQKVNSETLLDLYKANRSSIGDTVPLLNDGDSTIAFLEFTRNIKENNSSSVSYSLFGSEFYNVQNKYGRALLFLHTLPFKGLVDKGSVSDNSSVLFKKSVLNIFDQKGAYIQAPHSWVLFIGSLLYREANEILSFYSDDNKELLAIPREYGGFTEPKQDEFLLLDNSRKFGVGNPKDGYVKLDSVIRKLPQSVKNKFILEFKTWVDTGGFDAISQHIEIFTPDSTSDERMTFWIEFDDKLKEQGTEFYNNKILNPKLLNNYVLFQRTENGYANNHKTLILDEGSTTDKLTNLKTLMLLGSRGNPCNFYTELKDGSDAVVVIKNFLKEKRVLVNATWRIWANDLKSGQDNRIEGNSYPITFTTKNMNTYLTSFVKEFKSLNGGVISNEERIKNEIFSSTNSDDIYLTLYKNIKSIKDKWLPVTTTNGVEPINNLISSFKFIDRGYGDIGGEFKLNPTDVVTLLTSNYNNSFYSHITRVLSDNNFDFIPMPNYINYKDNTEVTNMFNTNTFDSMDTPTYPSFVCLYVGENSNSLGVGGQFKDNGVDILANDLPSDLSDVPAILVRYGDDQQSIFKDLELDQSEFSETNESLMVTDQIASSESSITLIGQNIFDIYKNRAYNSKVTMLGNAMIQPFMYYQLDNVPMFRGMYVIKKVTHSIKPNHMLTTMTGNRIRREKTKMLDKTTIFNNMIGNYANISTENADLNNLFSTKKREKIVDENNVGILRADYTYPDIYKDSWNKKIKDGDGFVKYLNKESNTQIKDGDIFRFLTYNEIFDKVEELTGVPKLTLQVMSFMESTIGQNKGVDDMNGGGYVGLMQFGELASVDAKPKIENIIFRNKKFDINQYVFHSEINLNKQTIFKLSSDEWHSGESSVNNKHTNSFFDDFISTLGAAFYAIQNTGSVEKTKNITDVYISHQQGKGGLNRILNTPNDIIHINLSKGNLPPGFSYEEVKYNEQWYIAWAGRIEATASQINSSNNKIVGGNIQPEILRGSDRHGSGHFGASRGGRKHEGLDLIAYKGQQIYSPFDGKISKYGWVYKDDVKYRYVEVTGDEYRCRVFYTQLSTSLSVGQNIMEKQVIGMAQGIEDKYAGITPHIHLELYDRVNTLINPTSLVVSGEINVLTT